MFWVFFLLIKQSLFWVTAPGCCLWARAAAGDECSHGSWNTRRKLYSRTCGLSQYRCSTHQHPPRAFVPASLPLRRADDLTGTGPRRCHQLGQAEHLGPGWEAVRCPPKVSPATAVLTRGLALLCPLASAQLWIAGYGLKSTTYFKIFLFGHCQNNEIKQISILTTSWFNVLRGLKVLTEK